MKYRDFRSGLTFKAVARELAHEAQTSYAQRGQYIPVTRSRVLGRWHQHKQSLWQHYKHSQGNDDHAEQSANNFRERSND